MGSFHFFIDQHDREQCAPKRSLNNGPMKTNVKIFNKWGTGLFDFIHDHFPDIQ